MKHSLANDRCFGYPQRANEGSSPPRAVFKAPPAQLKQRRASSTFITPSYAFHKPHKHSLSWACESRVVSCVVAPSTSTCLRLQAPSTRVCKRTVNTSTKHSHALTPATLSFPHDSRNIHHRNCYIFAGTPARSSRSALLRLLLEHPTRHAQLAPSNTRHPFHSTPNHQRQPHAFIDSH